MQRLIRPTFAHARFFIACSHRMQKADTVAPLLYGMINRVGSALLRLILEWIKTINIVSRSSCATVHFDETIPRIAIRHLGIR